MKMIAKKLGAFAAVLFLVVSSVGCSAAAVDGGTAIPGEITSTELNEALFLMPVNMDPNSSIESGLSIQGDASGKVIRMNFISASDDVQTAIADAEAIVRGYDLAVLDACMQRAEDDEDERLAEEWRSAREEDESSDGIGRIYDEFELCIVLDNTDGTLDLNGIREAGSEDGINWQ